MLLEQGLNLLFLVGFTFASTGTGLFVLNKAGLPFSNRGERIFFAGGAGFAVLGGAVFILASLQLLLPAAFYALSAAAIIISCAGWRGFVRLQGRIAFPLPQESRVERAAVLLSSIVVAAGLLMTLTPETGKDALVYHLAAPKLYLKHGGFYLIPGNIFSNYPLFNEMLFMTGLFFRGDTAARGMHFLVLFFVLLGMRQFSKAGLIGNAFPFLSILIFLSLPSVFVTASMAYVDLFAAYYSLASLYAFLRWTDNPDRRRLVLCGLFSGLAVASKYNALLLPLLGCLGVLWESRRRQDSPRRAVGHLLSYAIPAAIAGSPFYVKNLILTGNPVYPFLYGLFGGPGWSDEQARLFSVLLSDLGMGRSLLDYVFLPWNLSIRAKMDSAAFDGVLGLVFLLTLPFMVGMRKVEIPVRVTLAYSGLAFLFWASTAQQIRYLFPLFPLLSLLAGYTLTAYRGRLVLFPLLLSIIAGSLIFNGFHIARHVLEVKPLGVVTGSEDREEFLARMRSSYGMFGYVNKNLPDNSKIFMVYMKNWGFLCDRDFYSDSVFESYTLQKVLSSSASPEEVRRTLRRQGFTHLLCDLNYIYGRSSLFSPAEKSRFLEFQGRHLTALRNEGPYVLFRID